MGREGSLRTYPEIGVPDGHHPLSHHGNRPEALAKLSLINQFHASLRAFLAKLKATAGRRRHAARPLPADVRQRPQRQQPPPA